MNTTDKNLTFENEDVADDDAVALARLLSEMYDLWEARKLYQGIPRTVLAEHENRIANNLTDFLRLSHADRPAYIKAIHEDIGPREAVVFLVLAIRAACRVDDEGPGPALSVEMGYQWPFNLFLGLMLDDGHLLDEYPEAEREAMLNGSRGSPD